MRIARTFDRAMIVGPWGDMPAAADESAGVVLANLELANLELADLELVERQAVRARFPALAQRRFQIDEPTDEPDR